jgi:hypothetical protein
MGSGAGIQRQERALRDHCAVAINDQDDTGGLPAAGPDRAGTPRFRLVEIHVTSQAMRESPRPFLQFGPGLARMSQALAGLQPGLSEWSGRIARSLAQIAGAMAGTMAGPLSRLAGAVPENWRDIPYPCLEAALELMNDGMPLIWVPRSSVVAKLMQASRAAGRAEVLAEARQDVADDCDAVLADVTAPHLAPLAVMAAEAVRTLRDGYCAGAQALATDVFDTWLRLMVRRSILFDPPPKRIGFYPNVIRQIEPVSGDLPIIHLRPAGALAPVLLALARFFPGDQALTHFARHATVHAAIPEHYTDANAVVAVMLMTSALRQAQASGW